MQKWIILLIVLLILIIGIFVVLNVDIETEYIPETEITDTEPRKTMVTLYFKDKNTENISKETKLIDSKELLISPYEKIVQLLLEGPQNDSYEKTIPEGTVLNNTRLENGILILDFSNEFVEMAKDSIQLKNAIHTIVNTVTQLTEINSVKINVNSEVSNKFLADGIDFSQVFTNKSFENN